MNTLTLTAKDFKQSDSYWKDYIGTEDVSNYDGNIEIEGDLGYVHFVKLGASGFISANAGTGIKAGEGIEAGGGIKAGWGIEAGEGIEAGGGIKAGWGIEAGGGIKAGWGIEAGLAITCTLTLKASYRIFAGLKLWGNATDDEKTVTCGKLDGGEMAYGILKETGLAGENPKNNFAGKKIKVEIDGTSYDAVIQ